MKKSTVAMAIASALGLTHHPAHAAGTWIATGSLSESELTELFTLTEFNSENFSFNSENSDSK